MIKLVIGLGNIGKPYENTVHNMGFMVIDKLANKLGVEIKKKECSAEVGFVNVNGERIVLAKPTTYMNASGTAVKGLRNKYNLKNDEILVICDDIDLPRGKVRIREKGSAGTHNGLRDLVDKLGDGNFLRVRVGVGRPIEYVDLADYVLSKIKIDENLNSALENAANAVYDILEGETLQKVMGKYN